MNIPAILNHSLRTPGRADAHRGCMVSNKFNRLVVVLSGGAHRSQYQRQMHVAKSKIKLGLGLKSVLQKIGFANSVIEAITGNPAFDPGIVDLTDITDKNDELEAKLALRDAAKAAAEALTEAVMELGSEYDEVMKALVKVVEEVAAGDAEILESGGFDTFIPGKRTPAGPLGVVTGLVADPGNASGKIDSDWDSLEGADTYNIYVTTGDPLDEAGWVNWASRKQSRAVLTGLTPVTQYFIRVTGVGTEGEGPPSDPVPSVAP